MRSNLTFGEAVFAIKYLRNFGLDVDNDVFSSNSWYFSIEYYPDTAPDYSRNFGVTVSQIPSLTLLPDLFQPGKAVTLVRKYKNIGKGESRYQIWAL